jgi:rhodanese-related sulfurtransferase
MAQLAEFIGNHLLLSLAFLVTFFLLVMMTLSEKMQAFTSINPAQLTQLVNHQNAIVIDTRAPDAFAQGHITNAINIPLSDFTSNTVPFEKYKNNTVITYCISGITSRSACKKLINAGVENVYNLSGGIKAWTSDKLPVVKS